MRCPLLCAQHWAKRRTPVRLQVSTSSGRVVNEPTAAFFFLELNKKKDETVAVYDFGGGTFDVSILEVGEGVIEVKSTNGDTHLGGDNLDQRIVDWLIDEFKKDEGLDLRAKGNEMALQRLRDAAEKGQNQRAVDGAGSRKINLPFITADATGPKAPGEEADLGRSLSQLVEDIIVSVRSSRERRRWPTPESMQARSTRLCWLADRQECRVSRSWCKTCLEKSRIRA